MKNIYRTRAFVELFYRVRDFRYMALYRVFVVAILLLFTCMLRMKSTELMIQNMCVAMVAFIAPTWLIVHNCRIAAMRLCKKYKMENEFGKVNFLPDSVEINDFDVESRIVGYESISNYYKLKHYYFFLIITNEVIPIFVDKKSLTNEEMEKLELLVQQKMPQLKNQTAKTIKQRFAFYNLHSQGDLYGM